MKKTYITPSMETVKIASQVQLLAGSLPKGGSPITDEGNVLSREYDEW